MLLLSPSQGQIITASIGRDSPAMRADNQLLIGQGLQIGANSDLRHAKLLAELCHRNPPVLFN